MFLTFEKQDDVSEKAKPTLLSLSEDSLSNAGGPAGSVVQVNCQFLAL